MNHVIIIDDEVQSRNGIAEIFKNHSPGWEIDGLFEDGSLALDYLQQHPEVNLVVTDIRMPKFDGLELISRIRKNNGTIPIIIISGYSEFSYAKKAVELGAEGIGLCRTEHMFFGEGRIDAFREMICSTTVEERETALAKILPYQQEDFEGLFEALEGNPVTIRFLDPPLHEFVPTEEADIKKLADAQGKTVEEIKTIIDSLHEFNPMMGHRGCRLAVTYPEIAKMQTTAVIRAAIKVKNAHPDWAIKPEIMIPLVGDIKELKYVKKFVVETADAEIKAAGSDLQYEVGTMIEIPRAALTADDIAKEADFFCFGTNDLTQMTYGFSRDDAGKFLNAYYDAKIFENDPFAKLDQVGVGKLMKMAIELGRPVNPNLHVGICGEHGGDPSSVEFCHKIGLNYVSCSPFRVPIARLAAAQAAIAEKNA